MRFLFASFRQLSSALIIRPFMIASNGGMLVFQVLLICILYVSHRADGYLMSLAQSWARGSWFHLSQALLSYVPAFLLHRLYGLWLSDLDEQRKRHCYVIGVSGSGKSSTLENFLYRDAQSGCGAVLIEPHGELTDRFLHHDLFRLDHPLQAWKKLAILDMQSATPTPFNLFAVPLPEDEAEREIRIDELAASYLPAFRMCLSPQISESMEVMLRNALALTFYLPSPNLLDVLAILEPAEELSPRYENAIRELKNAVLRDYFLKDFRSKLAEKSKAPLRARLQNLVAPRQIQKALLAKENAIDFDEILREGKILVVRAKQERLGEKGAQMIGNLVHECLAAAAFRRNPRHKNTPFFCYLDECQNYLTPTVKKGLTEARKFGFHYVLANQFLGQDMTVQQKKVLLTCRVKLCGAVTAEDAYEMAREMNAEYHKRHLKVLKAGEFYLHTGKRLARFIKFPATFAVRTSLIGRKRIGPYMSGRSHKELMAVLGKPKDAAKDHIPPRHTPLRTPDFSRFNRLRDATPIPHPAHC